MRRDYSPFTPGSPVSPELFAGRLGEIETILANTRDAFETKRLAKTYIVGERGIGKSSLASHVGVAAERTLQALSVHVHLGGARSLDDMAELIYREIALASRDKAWWPKLRQLFGDHIKEVNLFGTKIVVSPPKDVLRSLWTDLAGSLGALLKELAGDRSGVFLVLDDINGLADSKEFADWLKSFVDSTATRGIDCPVHLVVVSTPERRLRLIEHNESLNRVFDVVAATTLQKRECDEFFSSTFSAVGVEVDTDALGFMTQLSGGYPVFMQEIGDAVFKQLEGDRVTHEDASRGVIQASRSLGRKHIEQDVLSAIKSSLYKNMLPVLAKNFFFVNAEFSRQHALEILVEEEQKNNFDNFIRAMVKLDVVVIDQRGQYRFRHQLHALYFALFASTSELGDADD